MKLEKKETTLPGSQLTNGYPPIMKLCRDHHIPRKQDCGGHTKRQKSVNWIDDHNENIAKKADWVSKKSLNRNSTPHKEVRAEDLVSTTRKVQVQEADIARLKTAYGRLETHVQKLNKDERNGMKESVKKLNVLLERLDEEGNQNLETLQSFFHGVKTLWYEYKEVKRLRKLNREKRKNQGQSKIPTENSEHQKAKMDFSSEPNDNAKKTVECQKPSTHLNESRGLSQIRIELVKAIELINAQESQRLISNKKYLPQIKRKTTPTYTTNPNHLQSSIEFSVQNAKKLLKQSEQVQEGLSNVEIDEDITSVASTECKGNIATFVREEEIKSVDVRGKTKQSPNSNVQKTVQCSERSNHHEKITLQTDFDSDRSLPPIPSPRHNPIQARDNGKKSHDCEPDQIFEERAYETRSPEFEPNHIPMSYKTRYINDHVYKPRTFHPPSSCTEDEIDLLNFPINQKLSSVLCYKCSIHGKEQEMDTFWNNVIESHAYEMYLRKKSKNVCNVAVQTATNATCNKSDGFVHTAINATCSKSDGFVQTDEKYSGSEDALKMRESEAPTKHLQATDVVVLIDIKRNKKPKRRRKYGSSLRTNVHNIWRKYINKNLNKQKLMENSGNQLDNTGLIENPLPETNERKEGNGFSDNRSEQENNLSLNINRPFHFTSQPVPVLTFKAGEQLAKTDVIENPIGPLLKTNERNKGNGFSDKLDEQENNNLSLHINRPFHFTSQSVPLIKFKAGQQLDKTDVTENPISRMLETNEGKDRQGCSDKHGKQENNNLGSHISRPLFSFTSQSVAILTPRSDTLETRKVRSAMDIGKHTNLLSKEKKIQKIRLPISLPPTKNIFSFHALDQGGDASNSIKCGNLHETHEQSVSNEEDEAISDDDTLSASVSTILSPEPKRRKMSITSIRNGHTESLPANEIMPEILQREVIKNCNNSDDEENLEETRNLLTSPPNSTVDSPVPKRRKLSEIKPKQVSGSSSDDKISDNKDNTPHLNRISQLKVPLNIRGLGESELLIYYSKPDELFAKHQLTERENEISKTVTAFTEVIKYTFASIFSASEKPAGVDQVLLKVLTCTLRSINA